MAIAIRMHAVQLAQTYTYSITGCVVMPSDIRLPY